MKKMRCLLLLGVMVAGVAGCKGTEPEVVTSSFECPVDTETESPEKERTETESVEKEGTEAESVEMEGTETAGEKEQLRMVKLDDKLYYDTGKVSNAARCGVMDFELDSSVESGQPTENNQTNFGTGYGGQYGVDENEIEVLLDGEWHIFSCQDET